MKAGLEPVILADFRARLENQWFVFGIFYNPPKGGLLGNRPRK
jgi:hypothetical protein